MDQGLETGKSSRRLDPLQNPKYVAPSWDEVYGMLVDLASEIRLSGYNPQVIVGVSRGGWPPARVMSDLLENPNLANMKVEFYKNIGVTAKRPKITQPVTSEVSGKRVLVVDDVADSGHSLRVASKHLVRKGAREIMVCTLYLKPKSVFKPNHYARITSKWVIFPWERLEVINLIKRNLRSDGRTYEIIRDLRGSFPEVDLQLLRADRVAGREHIVFSARNAVDSFQSKDRRAKHLSMEFLLFASGEHQITEAIKLLGVTASSRTLALVGLSETSLDSNRLSNRAMESVKGIPDDTVLQISTPKKAEDLKRAYNIPDKELNASKMRGEEDNSVLMRLIIERSALLALQN